MIDVVINGEKRNLRPSFSLFHLLEYLGYDPSSITVALNGVFVGRADYASVFLKTGDEVEIVSPMQGG